MSATVADDKQKARKKSSENRFIKTVKSVIKINWQRWVWLLFFNCNCGNICTSPFQLRA